jgi:hypothetical protein
MGKLEQINFFKFGGERHNNVMERTPGWTAKT